MPNVRSITPKDPANFTPELGNYKALQPFRYWCQKVLPLVYDDSLSYYELLCKVVDYLNKTMEDVETLHSDVNNLHATYEELQSYVNSYFSSLDVQEEINNKLDNMAESGKLYEIIRRYTDPIVNEQNEKINVLKARMDTFATLPDGSTSGNAELADIRVGYNGTVYPSAGEAVREQVGELNRDITQFTQVININKKIDTTASYAGIRFVVNTEYNMIGLISQHNTTAIVCPVNKGDNLIITGIGNKENTMPICMFSDTIPSSSNAPVVTQTVLSQSYWETETINVVAENDGYVCFNILTNDTQSGALKQVNALYTNVDNGIYVNNNEYTHFNKIGDNTYLCRVFKNMFVNNVVDLYEMYIGQFVDGALTKISSIGTNESDIVGPILIHDGDYRGEWVGSGHGVNIDGTEYPTAKPISVIVRCNGIDVTSSIGLHIGNVTIENVNELYFPKSITGADLNTATKAIEETRIFVLGKTMVVREQMKFLGDYFIQRYYGPQLITYDMETLYLPNNMVTVPIQGRAGMPNYYFEKRENEYLCYASNGHHYDMKLARYGLGDFQLYDGTADDLKYGYLANFFINKIYFGLCGKSVQINTGTVVGWEAHYNYWFG